MSDLQCPATLFVVRHAEAVPDGARLSDDDRPLTELGLAQAAELADRLADEHVLSAYSSPLIRARDTAAPLVQRRGIDLEVIDDLREYSVGAFGRDPNGRHGIREVVDAWAAGDLQAGVPEAESGTQIVERLRSALEDVADRHRGETVLVVTHGGVMSLALPWLCRNGRQALGRNPLIPNCAVARIRIDADGWVVDDWP